MTDFVFSDRDGSAMKGALAILSRPNKPLDPSFLSVRRRKCYCCGVVSDMDFDRPGHCSNVKCVANKERGL